MLNSTVGENEAIKSLMDEITRQKSLVEARDASVNQLMKSEKEAVRIREEIKRDLDQTKKDRDLQKEQV